MLKEIKMIMDKAKNEKVDIGVATSMLISNGNDAEIMDKALKVYNSAYEEISELHNKGDEENMAKVVELAGKEDFEGIKALMDEIRGV